MLLVLLVWADTPRKETITHTFEIQNPVIRDIKPNLVQIKLQIQPLNNTSSWGEANNQVNYKASYNTDTGGNTKSIEQ